uniref:Uncharacterized protein n=2 Tax=Haptolina brevifila TaxID=156173 RepID=A0A7S2JMN1_9EUKA|mmetsp:Transcript_84791/g.169374  ORF Transcript_84791/g.169374 Transcript_84791/m.169374 type:complete len:352 (+) Transcript_84791:376-1431(+)
MLLGTVEEATLSHEGKALLEDAAHGDPSLSVQKAARAALAKHKEIEGKANKREGGEAEARERAGSAAATTCPELDAQHGLQLGLDAQPHGGSQPHDRPHIGKSPQPRYAPISTPGTSSLANNQADVTASTISTSASSAAESDDGANRDGVSSAAGMANGTGMADGLGMAGAGKPAAAWGILEECAGAVIAEGDGAMTVEGVGAMAEGAMVEGGLFTVGSAIDENSTVLLAGTNPGGAARQRALRRVARSRQRFRSPSPSKQRDKSPHRLMALGTALGATAMSSEATASFDSDEETARPVEEDAAGAPLPPAASETAAERGEEAATEGAATSPGAVSDAALAMYMQENEWWS